MMPVRGVIFDMGGTLLSYHPPQAAPKHGWREMEDLGADALRVFLQELGYNVPSPEDARAINFAVMERYWRAISEQQKVNPRLGDMLVDVLQAMGVPAEALADGLLDSAVAAYVAPIQAIVRPLEGAQATLQALQTQGLQLGLFSNTVWPGAFHLEDLARWGLDAYLECAFFSADVGAWKPAPEVFQMTVQALGLQPQDAVYVGDHPLFDIYGAQRAGLRGVWIYGKEWEDYAAIEETVPDATLKRLPDLIDVLAAWTDC